jgi:hypothetical protein
MDTNTIMAATLLVIMIVLAFTIGTCIGAYAVLLIWNYVIKTQKDDRN